MDVDCHPCASKQEQIVKFACSEQGLGRAGERSKRSSWCKGRSGVRGRFATERRTVKLRYLASSCEKVSTKNSICGSRLGTFRLSRSTVSCQTNRCIPDPPPERQFQTGRIARIRRWPFSPLLATPGRGQTISGAAAMPVPSSIDTGTPAPAIRLPLDPAPTSAYSPARAPLFAGIGHAA